MTAMSDRLTKLQQMLERQPIIGAAGVDVLFGQNALEAVFCKEQGDDVLSDILLA